MKRRFIRIITSAVAALSVAAIANAPQAMAYNTLGCKWASSSISFYVPSPYISYPYWGNAAGSWGGLDGHLLWNTRPADFTGLNESRGNTVVWTGVTRAIGTVQDFPPCTLGYWVSGQMEVVLNWPLVSGYSASKIQGVAAHEIGHAFGLAHNTASTGILMYPYDSRTVSGPASDDKAGVNALY